MLSHTPDKKNRKIDIFIDLDGVAVAQPDNLNDVDFSTADITLPDIWGYYKRLQIITLQQQGRTTRYLLLPGLYDMLIFFIHALDTYVNTINFFSAAPEERNVELVELIGSSLHTILKTRKTEFKKTSQAARSSIPIHVYSRENCTIVDFNSDHQPTSDNNPHIPTNSVCWKQNIKKKLDVVIKKTKNAILIDNNCHIMVNGETHHLLKVPTFKGISGTHFLNHLGAVPSEHKSHNENFFQEPHFFRTHLAWYITAMIHLVGVAMQDLRITAVCALKSLQICAETNKYKYANPEKALHERYDPELYYLGYSLLSKINPQIPYVPHPHANSFLKSFTTLRLSSNSFIRSLLIQNNKAYWPPVIYDHIQGYYGKYEEEPSLETNKPRKSTKQHHHPISTSSTSAPSTPSITSPISKHGLPSLEGIFAKTAKEAIKGKTAEATEVTTQQPSLGLKPGAQAAEGP